MPTDKNFTGAAAATTLSSGINSGAASLSVADGSTYPSANFNIVVDRGLVGEEKIFISSRSGNTFTVGTRGDDGTTASAHATGAAVEHCGFAEDFQENNDHINATADVHGLSGGAAVVGTSQAQTLTNKTVSLGSNTVSGTTAQFNTALSDGDFATLAGTETLANKTLTAPTIVDFTNAQHDHGDADDGGAVTPTFKGVKVHKSAAQSLNNATDTALTFNTESFDTNAFHDTGSNTSRLTVPSGLAGKYRISAVMNMGTAASGLATMNLYKNGDNLTFLATDEQAFNSTANNYLRISTTLDLSVADYVEVWMFQSSGSSKNTSSGVPNSFEMTYLGA